MTRHGLVSPSHAVTALPAAMSLALPAFIIAPTASADRNFHRWTGLRILRCSPSVSNDTPPANRHAQPRTGRKP